jgi:hypothetical protein
VLGAGTCSVRHASSVPGSRRPSTVVEYSGENARFSSVDMNSLGFGVCQQIVVGDKCLSR